MLFIRSAAVLVLLALLVGIAASAGASDTVFANTAGDKGIIVTHDKKPGPMMILSITDSVSQGETDWWSRVLSGYATTMDFDLYWGNPSNSLRMKIYAPDGSTYGPYYDNVDGKLDGFIPITLYNSGGLPQGTYYIEIYGYSVSGTQSYTLY